MTSGLEQHCQGIVQFYVGILKKRRTHNSLRVSSDRCPVLRRNSLSRCRRNFDVEQEYDVLVRDGGSPSLSALGRLTLIIDDMNDCPPLFTQSVYIFDVLENCQRGTPVGTVSASDDDGWPFNVVRFSCLIFSCPQSVVELTRGHVGR